MTSIAVRRAFRDERGMTLIEVVIATAIVLIGLVSLISVLPLAIGHIGEGNGKTTAVFLAEQRMEQVKNTVWKATPAPTDTLGVSNPNTAPPPTFPDEAYGAIASYPRYRRQVRIQDCGVAPGCPNLPLDPNMRQVTVSVFFFPLTGTGEIGTVEEPVKVTSFIARRL